MARISGGKISVAIIEDDDDVRLSTRLLLETHGYSATPYKSAEDFLAASANRDCLLLDPRLPGLSAMDLLERMQKYGPRMPVILIASDAKLWNRRAKRMGIDALLEKPLWAGELLARLDKMSGRH
jgi:FixJ family two-component response regulator